MLKKKSRLEDVITVQRLARYRYRAHLHVKIATAEMDTFVIRKSKNVAKIVDSLLESSDPCTSTKHKSKTPSDQSWKRRKYQEEFIKYGFTCSIVNNVDFPQCVICSEVLAHESMKPGKMQRHLETKHPSFIEKPIDFFRRKEKELQGQKHMIAQQAKITSNALETFYEGVESSVLRGCHVLIFKSAFRNVVWSKLIKTGTLWSLSRVREIY